MGFRHFITSCLLPFLPFGTLTVIGTPGDLAAGSFYRNLSGVSTFISTGSTASVYGTYARLKPNGAYFTVAYANGNCDPAQAFPVGPFTTDRRGRATLAASVPLTVDLGATRSVSVRIGDTAADLDGDGLTGPTDVVAVPGNPSVGLVECDYRPSVLNPS